MLVVTEVVSIASEKVTEMLSLIETLLWLSVGEIEETLGAVVSSEVVLEVSDDSSESSLQEIRVRLIRNIVSIFRKCLMGFLIC